MFDERFKKQQEQDELEKIEELMDMLTGDQLPEGMNIKCQPQLSRRQASSVVWFLQEHMNISYVIQTTK